jgi:phospholipid/cholesterol/gamma-HCH transport system ATP-binding protein
VTVADMITTHGLDCGYGDHVVLRGVDLAFPKGEVTCMIGPSGGGKSTLLRTLLLLQPALAGDVRLEGRSLLGLEARDRTRLREHFGVLFQGAALFGDLSLTENVAFPLIERRRVPAREAEGIARLKLGLVGLSADADRMPSEVSGGMRKRCGIARALALDPEVLFLDEPGSGLDPPNAAALDALLLDLRDGLGSTLIVITHEIDSVRRIADRIVILGEGGVLAAGTRDEVLLSSRPEVAAFLSGELGPRARTGTLFPILP